jgi:signal transduction histidine kinase/HAMP domain-containing protein
MRWWQKQGLNFKVALGIIMTMVLVLGAAFIAISQYIRAQLWQSEIQKSENFTAIAATLLEDAMLAGHKDTVHDALNKLGQNAGDRQLNSIAVYDDRYVLTSFASGFPGSPTVQAENMPKNIEDPSCWGCHQLPVEERPSYQVVVVEGREVIRSSVPLYNEERCQTCHGTGKHVLGDIMVDYSQDQFKQAYISITLGLGGASAIAVGLVVLVLYQVLRRIVLGPMSKFVEIAGAISHGALERRIEVQSHDEIGLLAQAFNGMTAQLRGLIGSLEARVAARTRDLELAADVGRNLAQEHNLDRLLANAVELIRARFDLYYTQIYLTDPEGHSLALRAGTGSAGRELLQRAHRLPVGPGSINGRTAAEQRAVIVADTATGGTFRSNPLLPDTRSEMAVPLLIGDRVVGVLDLQSDQPGALTEENLPTFEALAGQLAIAIQNAGLFAEAEQARAEVELQARGLVRSGWQEFLNAIDRGERRSYTYNQHSPEPLNEHLPLASNDRTLAVPITLIGEPIGAIHLERDVDAEQAWTRDDTELVSLVAARVARQAENLRLLAQAEQYRAEAEAATRRLTREGWEGYLETVSNPGYVYDLNEVTPLDAAPNSDGSPLASQPLKVQDEIIGELAVDGVESLDEEDMELLAKVAEHLSATVENLRLTEQVQLALAEQVATVTRLRELDHLKSSFLANMSHELRTPLNSILGFTDVLLEGLDGSLTDAMENDLKLIGRNGQHLLSLINDVLDMAKIEAGKMNLSVEHFNLGELLEEVLDITGPLAREKSLDLRLENESTDGLELHADRIRLRQAMINLVGNAIKFTETGGIFVQAERDDGCIRVRVRDTGVGVRPEQAQIIFEEFGQVNTSTTRTTGGTGLGLPISKRLIEMHGGQLWVESSGVPGAGSTFIIELPAVEAHPLPEVQAQ